MSSAQNRFMVCNDLFLNWILPLPTNILPENRSEYLYMPPFIITSYYRKLLSDDHDTPKCSFRPI